MENSEKEKVTAQYLNRIEKRIDNQDRKIDEIDTKVDQRHIDIVKMQGSMKGAEEASNRMANAVDKLVVSLENSNARHDKRFETLSTEIQDVKGKIEGQEENKKLKLEERKMNNTVLVALIAGLFGIVQILVNVIAPILFGG
ncbi:MAG TPA: hypothetical protein K8V44_04540 [Staphylococcus saprophyticus]|nr:hypothetical protein [Staphylococcus saprophyticus]